MNLPINFLEWQAVYSVVSGFLLGMSIRLVALDINCGFARTAIREHHEKEDQR